MRSPRGERAAVEGLHYSPLMLMVGGDRIRRVAREAGRTDGRICARGPCHPTDGWLSGRVLNLGLGLGFADLRVCE